MFRSVSPYGNDTNSYSGSIQSNDYSSAVEETLSEVSNVSRPNAKSIYLQRQEYAASVNKMMNRCRYKVEHLFTCDLDGWELRGVPDCVERLKLLEGAGRVWGQDMMLEVRGVRLLLTDTDTKEELESIALSDVLELKAVMNSCVYNSLLTMSVQRGRCTTLFMFQCDAIMADQVERDLMQALMRRRAEPHAYTAAGEESEGAKPKETPAPEEEKEEEEEPVMEREEPGPGSEPGRPAVYTELDRSVDILNHILSDLEAFMAQVAAVTGKNPKMKKKKKKGKAMAGLPPPKEFAECLHKIKSGFNLLAELNGQIQNPSAAEFVHILFSALTFVLSHCPDKLSEDIVSPLLTPQCVRFLSEEATPQEDQVWQELGDAWNIPSTQWPEDEEDVPTHTLSFSDCWEPPEVTAAPHTPRVRPPPQATPTQSSAKSKPQQQQQQQQHEVKAPRSAEPKRRLLKVLYDFSSRNQRELTVSKGETVELLDKSKQWWMVRNVRGEGGFVPNNVLTTKDEGREGEEAEEYKGSPVLMKTSKPPDVKAWLEDKGFSPITVRCLCDLSGAMLLSMSRDELKTVCPEEGGRVFFQLQAVKSSLSAAS